jgi:hypothetical protein
MAHILDLQAVEAGTDAAASAPTADSALSVLGCGGASSLSVLACN